MTEYNENEANDLSFLDEDYSQIEEKSFFSDIPELKGCFQITGYTTTLADATAKDTGMKYKRVDINLKCKLNEVIATKQAQEANDFIGKETSLFLSIRKMDEATELSDKGKLMTFIHSIKMGCTGTLKEMLDDIVGEMFEAVVKKSNSYIDANGDKVEGRNRIRPETVKGL